MVLGPLEYNFLKKNPVCNRGEKLNDEHFRAHPAIIHCSHLLLKI